MAWKIPTKRGAGTATGASPEISRQRIGDLMVDGAFQIEQVADLAMHRVDNNQAPAWFASFEGRITSSLNQVTSKLDEVK